MAPAPARDHEHHRNKWMIIGKVLSAIGLFSTLFGAWISPRIVEDSRREWREDTKAVLMPLLNRLDRIESRLDGYIDRGK